MLLDLLEIEMQISEATIDHERSHASLVGTTGHENTNKGNNFIVTWTNLYSVYPATKVVHWCRYLWLLVLRVCRIVGFGVSLFSRYSVLLQQL